MNYTQLLSRGKIGALELKNRIVCMPVGAPLADLEGFISDDYIAYYEERAKGGAGLIITGVIVIDNETGVIEPNLAWLTNPLSLRSWKKLTDAIHKYDTKIFAQIYHPGKETHSREIGGRQVLSVSPTVTKFGEQTREITVDEMRALKQKFVDGALLAQKADFDGVEIHCAHGYLLCDFLSPDANRRTDEYGGCFENRVKYPSEIISAIRSACGPRFPISVRFSADEFTENGLKIEEGVRVAQHFESLGIDLIDVSAGNQETSHLNREPASFRQGWKKHLAASVKAGVNIPVLAVNTVKRPDFAEQLLEDGVCDFVGLARGHLADPYFAEKCRTGHSDEIRNCIGCLVCFETLIQRKRKRCSVNPCLMREREFSHIERDGAGRRVAVVGGGPGGMEAARVLALRGFDVTLYEKGAELGGQLNYADKPPLKEKITWLRDAMQAQLKSAGVKVILNCAVTPEFLKAGAPEGVFLCSGSEPIRPGSIPGIHGANVFTVPEVLSGKAVLDGKRVVIIGSGLSGLETGVFLAERGCKLNIVEMLDAIGKGIYYQSLNDVLGELKTRQPDVGLYPSHTLLSINENGIHLKNAAGAEFDIAADAVVLSMGVRPNTAFKEAMEAAFDKVVLVGDASKGGRIADATNDGFGKAWVFEP